MPDAPSDAGGVQPLATSANLAGVAREALLASVGQAQLSALVREALLQGALANTGTLATTEGLDSAAFAGTASWPAITGTLATTEATDRASFSGIDAWAAITGSLAATETPDSAAFAGSVTWPLVAGSLATTEATDVAAFTGSPGLIPTITIKLGMQILVNRQSTLGYWVPAIVTGIALDQVPIVFGCWSQGPALGTSGQMGIMLNIADHGTTWVAAGGAP